VQNEKPTAMVWLRNDLRIIDQQSLSLAKQSGLKLVAYYSFDPRNYETTPWGFPKTASFRAQFLIESVAELQRSLSALNITLIIDNRPPEQGILDWVNRLNISQIFFQKEWTDEERSVEDNLRAALPKETEFFTHYDQFLFHPEDIPFKYC